MKLLIILKGVPLLRRVLGGNSPNWEHLPRAIRKTILPNSLTMEMLGGQRGSVAGIPTKNIIPLPLVGNY